MSYEEEKEYVTRDEDGSLQQDPAGQLSFDSSVLPSLPPSYIITERLCLGLPVWIQKVGPRRQPLDRKLVPWTITVGEHTYQYQVEIVGAKGLPTTLDMQLFHALEEIATKTIERQGGFDSGPLSVQGSELIKRASKIKSGATYQDVLHFFERIFGLSIYAYTSPDQPKKNHRAPAFHILSSMLRPGEQRLDGSINPTWEIQFSQWYHRSLQAGNCLLMDHAGFQRLTRPIAMLLHQFLYEAFYRGRGIAEHDYRGLTDLLVLPQYTARSRIQQQLDPAHAELKTIGLLKAWDYRPVKGTKNYTIFWEAGKNWWQTMAEMRAREMFPDQVQGVTTFLPEGIQTDFKGTLFVDKAQQEALVGELIRFDGNNRTFLNFYKQAARDLPATDIYRIMGNLRERLAMGWRPRKSVGHVLVSDLKRTAGRQGLSWGTQGSPKRPPSSSRPPSA